MFVFNFFHTKNYILDLCCFHTSIRCCCWETLKNDELHLILITCSFLVGEPGITNWWLQLTHNIVKNKTVVHLSLVLLVLPINLSFNFSVIFYEVFVFSATHFFTHGKLLHWQFFIRLIFVSLVAHDENKLIVFVLKIATKVVHFPPFLRLISYCLSLVQLRLFVFFLGCAVFFHFIWFQIYNDFTTLLFTHSIHGLAYIVSVLSLMLKLVLTIYILANLLHFISVFFVRVC